MVSLPQNSYLDPIKMLNTVTHEVGALFYYF